MKFTCTKDQRYTLVFALTGGFESPSKCHNNIPIGTTVPRGTEWYFHQAFCGTVSVPRHARVYGNGIVE
jgi:hypothetical protein